MPISSVHITDTECSKNSKKILIEIKLDFFELRNFFGLKIYAYRELGLYRICL